MQFFSVEISETRGIGIVLAGFEVGSVTVNTDACFQIYINFNARHLLHPSHFYILIHQFSALLDFL